MGGEQTIKLNASPLYSCLVLPCLCVRFARFKITLHTRAVADAEEVAAAGGNKPTGIGTATVAAASEGEAAGAPMKRASPLCSPDSTAGDRNAYLRAIGTDVMKQVEGILESWMRISGQGSIR